jgi:hypothetical protein
MLKRVLASACLLLHGSLSQTRLAQQTPYALADIRAYLYYQSTGTFGTANITTDGSPNAVIGESFKEGPTDATLILVTIKGDFGGSAHPPRLRVMVVQTSPHEETLLRQTVDLRTLLTGGPTVFVPFIAFRTGCATTRVSADLLDSQGRTQGSLAKTIDFACGE